MSKEIIWQMKSILCDNTDTSWKRCMYEI